MFQSISSKWGSIVSSLKTSRQDPVGEVANGVLARIRPDQLIVKNQRLWKLFRLTGYVTLCLGAGVGGIMAAIGLLAIVFAVLIPFWIAGGYFGSLSSLICYVTGMPKDLWLLLCQLIAISPGIVILRMLLPIWWRIVSWKIIDTQPADGGKQCIS